MKQNVPRLMIAGTNSGCGKTTMTCGILSALKLMGIRAASGKCGPDYIDPMFHSQIFGIPSRNLDLFFTNKEQVSYLLSKCGKDADITVMEGGMGVFDGMQMEKTDASSYDLAKQTQTPIVLIVNAKGMALSVVPLIKGFLEYRKDHTIKGVILNGVSPMTGKMLTEIVERELPIKVYGCVPTLSGFKLASRHLGLVTPFELEQIQEDMRRLGEEISKYVKMDELLELASLAPDLEDEMPMEWKDEIEAFQQSQGTKNLEEGRKLRIGVAKDKAFCFYYQDNLEILESFGCELVPFSPLEDKELPNNLDGVLIGGGYPEVYAKDLSENETFRSDLKNRLDAGLPCMAECGGFMYLHEKIEDEHGEFYEMVGAIKGTSSNQKKLVRFGYISLESKEENPYLKKNEIIKAHEFHYWDSDNNGEKFEAIKPSGKRRYACEHASETLLAGYPHLYYYSNLKVVKRFLEQCRK